MNIDAAKLNELLQSKQSTAYKSLGNYLADKHGAMTKSLSNEKGISVVGKTSAVQKQGLGNVLLLSLILDNLFQKKIHLTDSVTISRQAARESKSARAVPLKEGEKVALYSLLEAFIIHDSPNAMLALAAHVYGNSNQALKEIEGLAERLSINLNTVKNVTGRKITNKPQITTMTDLFKAAKYLFNRLPYELAY